jgi:multidrug efflux pump subunit AcrB
MWRVAHRGRPVLVDPSAGAEQLRQARAGYPSAHSGVAKVDLLGTQDERIFIEVSSATLADRGLTGLDIQAALAGQNAMDSGGGSRLTTDQCALTLRAGFDRSRKFANCG